MSGEPSAPPSGTSEEMVGYRLILPDGWSQLDVRQDVDVTVAGALAQIRFDGIPRDERAKRRAAVEGRLRQAIAGARKVDAYAMYMALNGMHGNAVPASFVVGEATNFSSDGPVEDVLAQLLTAADATAVVLDGSDAVRTEAAIRQVDDVSGHEIPARQITYTVPVPASRQWLVIVFDVISDEGMDEDAQLFVAALVALFDAVMTTFRWRVGS